MSTIKGLARTTDPETSHLAAQMQEYRPLAKIAQALLEVMRDVREPISDGQMYMGIVQRHGDKWTDRAVRHGRKALVDKGFIEPHDEKILNDRNCWCKAYKLTDKGATTDYVKADAA